LVLARCHVYFQQVRSRDATSGVVYKAESSLFSVCKASALERNSGMKASLFAAIRGTFT